MLQQLKMPMVLPFFHHAVIEQVWVVLAALALGAIAGLTLWPLARWIPVTLIEDDGGRDDSEPQQLWLGREDEYTGGASDAMGYLLILTLGCSLMAGACVSRFGFTWGALAAYVFATVLLVLAVIDAQWRLLPDLLTIPLIWAGLLANIVLQFASLPAAILGAVIGYGLLWLLFLPARLAGQEDGIGHGDFKLYAAVGAWLGWLALPQVFLLSLAAGFIYLLAVRLRGKEGSRPSPFGPFIVIAALLTLCNGTPLNPWIHLIPI